VNPIYLHDYLSYNYFSSWPATGRDTPNRIKTRLFYIIVGTLAFCSIAYELLLGQILSAFLGNTVLRYSVTIGLYMLSMGIGSFAVRDRILAKPIISLQVVELALSLIGGFSLISLFVLDFAGVSETIFSVTAHALIIVIGFLTGLEIPLLIAVRNAAKPDSDSKVLGMDYIGACVGALVFAFVLYPHTGLIQSAFLIALLNSIAGLTLASQKTRVPKEQRPRFQTLIGCQAVLLLVLLGCLANASPINEFLVHLYLA
jgi:spermidine synthase